MRVWLRSRDSIDAGQMLHSAALAFASDYLLVEPVMRQHSIPWATPGLRVASLDHAMWFHRPFRVDGWSVSYTHLDVYKRQGFDRNTRIWVDREDRIENRV